MPGHARSPVPQAGEPDLLDEPAVIDEPAAAWRAVTGRYVLVTFCQPSTVDAQGRRWLDELWVKDLVEHLRYIRHLTLVAPCEHREAPARWVRVDDRSDFRQVRFVDLPPVRGKLDALRHLPQTLRGLRRAIRDADIVHYGVAAWPIPEAWLVTPLLRGPEPFRIVVVDAAFWRMSPGRKPRWQSRLRAGVAEVLNRWCVRSAHLSLFTQDEYRRSLLGDRAAQGHTIHASWIDAQWIVPGETARQLWRTRLAAAGHGARARLLFAGRLTAEKGIEVLLRAAGLVASAGVAVDLDILGEGELADACAEACRAVAAPVRLRMLGTVAYGAPLFDLVRTYHAVLVPSLSDEQPRIVYDAFSQAVPVLGSATPGIRECVQDGLTGRLFASADPAALAEAIVWATRHPDELSRMGAEARLHAMGLTHQEMHRRRWRLLTQMLDESLLEPPPPSLTLPPGDARPARPTLPPGAARRAA